MNNCCCGTASSDCCSDGVDESSSYSCEDDAYRGPKRTVVVDFLFLDLATCDRCQGADDRVYEAVSRCKRILSACGINLVLNQLLIDNEEKARMFRFQSSPTIRVNGVDICDEVIENECCCCSDMSDSPVKCRLFPFNDTYYEVPPTDMIIKAILEIAIKGETASDSEEEYVLPDNLHVFFSGVDRMADKGVERPNVPEERKRSSC